MRRALISSVAAAALILVACVCALTRPGLATAATRVQPDGVLAVAVDDPAFVDGAFGPLYAFSGSPQTGFSEPQLISEPGDEIGDVQLVGDAAGDLLAVWNAERSYQAFSDQSLYKRPMSRGVWYARRAGGSAAFGAPQQLLPPGAGTLEAAAMDPAGEATIAYIDKGSLFVRRAPTGDGFGAPMLVESSGSVSGAEAVSFVYLAVTEAGELVVVFQDHGAIEARLERVGGSFGSTQLIAPGPSHGFYNPRAEWGWIGEGMPVVSDDHGDVLLTWVEDYGNGGRQIDASYRPAGGSFGAPQKLTPVQRLAENSTAAAVGIDAAGHAVLAVTVSREERPHLLEILETDAAGRLRQASVTAAPVSLGVLGMRLAATANGEFALLGSYNTPLSGSSSNSGSAFTTQAQFGNGGPFSTPEVLEEGTNSEKGSLGGQLQAVSGAHGRLPEVAPVGAGGFDTVLSLSESGSQAGGSTHGERGLVRIRSISHSGIGGPVDVPLPAAASSSSRRPSPQPASVFEAGETVRMDSRGQVQGQLTCGNAAGRSCRIALMLTTAGTGAELLSKAEATLTAFASQMVTFTLPTAAQQQVESHGSLQADVMTETAAEEGPATRTEYPVTILPPARKASHRKRHGHAAARHRSNGSRSKQRRRARGHRDRHRPAGVVATDLRFSTLAEHPTSSLFTDGARWAAYEPSAGTTVLLDTKTGRRAERKDPEGCSGGLIALGSGELLYQCANPACPDGKTSCWSEAGEYEPAGYVIESISDAAQQRLPSLAAIITDSPLEVSLASHGLQGGGLQMQQVGSQWVQGQISSYRGSERVFVNWHTGEILDEASEPARSFEDLDSPSLLVPLCAPLLRAGRAEPLFVASRLEPVRYRQPFALAGGEDEGGNGPGLRLLHCGSHAARQLPGGSAPAGGEPYEPAAAQLGAGIATWLGADRNEPGEHPDSKEPVTRYDTIYLTRLRTHGQAWHGSVYRMLAKGAGVNNPSLLIQHTSTMIFESYNEYGSRWIYAAQMPWRPAASEK